LYWLGGLTAALVVGCELARLPGDAFACSVDTDCDGIPGADRLVCREGICVRPDAGDMPDAGDAGGASDAGDAGPGDGGDAGPGDAGCVPLTCSTGTGSRCGTFPDGCGDTITCPACGTGFSCSSNLCVACPPDDEPDDAFLDRNCDGIDGNADASVFMAQWGSDSNPGTLALPVASLPAARAVAMSTGKRSVLVAAGTYPVTDAGFSWDVPASIHGGYSGAQTWARSSANTVVIRPTAAGLRVAGLSTPVTLDHLWIAPAATPTTSGAPSFGLRVVNCAQLTIRHSTVQALTGAAGAAGSGPVTHGDPGQDGAEGTAAMAGFPGQAGQAGQNPSCPSANGGPGGVGGDSPTDARQGRGEPGRASTAGVPGGDGGMTGGCYIPGNGCGSNCPAGYPQGEDGQQGSNGTAGSMGPSGGGGNALGTLTGEQWTPSDGAPGDAGNPGRGGGGGGGGGIFFISYDTGTCFPHRGGGGGGGGAGGCGGSGGAPGRGGGASVAMLLVNSNVTLHSVDVRSSGGGAGGAGQPGGLGGMGGRGGPGGAGIKNVPIEFGGDGGSGGRGGTGGPGGPGGGGGGGPSIGVWCSSAASRVTTDGGTTFIIGAGGMGGSSQGQQGATGLTAAIHGCP
jgi:hypothetical protein